MNPTAAAVNPEHENLLELEAKYCSWGDTVHYAKELTMFQRSEGSFLYDDKGTQYLDLQMWYSAANFGYGNVRINSALKRQMDVLPQLACQYLHKEKIILATKLARKMEAIFGEKGRVHFNVGGASAVEDAWKVVRIHTKKIPAFSFMGGYHGRTFGATSLTSSYRYREQYGHFSDKANFIPYPYCFRCPYGKQRETCGMYCVQQFERLFETEYYGVSNKHGVSEFGAFFIEAVQGTGGYIVPPKDYFPGLKKILDAHKILLVDDEIQMGFYRTGKFMALENFGVKPDVVVMGKALTNGMNAISAIWAREELINPTVFPPGSTHSTFSSNTLGTAVALETVNLMEEEDFETRVTQRGAYFLQRLKALQKKYPEMGDVDGLGLALRVEMCQKDGYTPNRALVDAMMNIGLSGTLTTGGKSKGLILDVGGYYKNVFTMAPSLYISEQEVDTAIDLFEEAMQRGIAHTA